MTGIKLCPTGPRPSLNLPVFHGSDLCMGQVVLDTRVQQAAALCEPQRGVCRRTAGNNGRSVEDGQFLVFYLDMCRFIWVQSHLKGVAAAWQPGGN